MTKTRKTRAGKALTDGLNILLKPQAVTPDGPGPRPLDESYGLPARGPEEYYITELYHRWIEDCRKAKSFAPSKPDVVFRTAFKLGLEYALNNQQSEQ